jgi:preprotein translocase subunit SecA
MFANMIETVKQQTLTTLFRIKIASEEEVDREAMEKKKRQQADMRLSRGGNESAQSQQQPLKREGDKIGRNEPCPCGSGKKYKKCCGRLK